MKGVRRAVSSVVVELVLPLSLPLALAFSLPYGVLGFSAAEGVRPKTCTAAFVSLSAEDEDAAMRVAKSSWQVNAGGVRMMRVDMSVGELPEEKVLPVIGEGPSLSRPLPPLVDYGLPPLLPSRAAAAPARLADDGGNPAVGLPFPKEELLTIE